MHRTNTNIIIITPLSPEPCELPLPLVICINKAICWRSDIGALLEARPPEPEPPEPLPPPPVPEAPRGRDEAGIAGGAWQEDECCCCGVCDDDDDDDCVELLGFLVLLPLLLLLPLFRCAVEDCPDGRILCAEMGEGNVRLVDAVAKRLNYGATTTTDDDHLPRRACAHLTQPRRRSDTKQEKQPLYYIKRTHAHILTYVSALARM